MKTLRKILFILTLISVPTTIVLSIILINPFLYIITLILLGITTIVHNIYLYNKVSKDKEDDLLYDEFIKQSIEDTCISNEIHGSKESPR